MTEAEEFKNRCPWCGERLVKKRFIMGWNPETRQPDYFVDLLVCLNCEVAWEPVDLATLTPAEEDC